MTLPGRQPSFLLLACLAVSGATDAYVSWRSVEQTNVPSGRAAAAFSEGSTQSMAVGGEMWLFGGVTSDAPLTYTNELWKWQARTSRWSKPSTLGTSPVATVGSSMCAIGHKLFLLGGADTQLVASGTLYTFDTLALTWASPTTYNISIPSRSYHTLECTLDTVYLFGGMGDSGTLGDTYSLDPDTNYWTVAPTTGSMLPVARKGHSLTYGSGRLYLFGGDTGTRYCRMGGS